MKTVNGRPTKGYKKGSCGNPDIPLCSLAHMFKNDRDDDGWESRRTNSRPPIEHYKQVLGLISEKEMALC